MRIALLVQGAPHFNRAPTSALAFARAAVAAGHAISRAFFYKDGVILANRFNGDTEDLRTDWTTLAEGAAFELAVCVASGERRGIREGETLSDGFEVVGLGQFIEAVETSDRLVSF